MNQQRFLIARIDRIGDAVLSTPLPREIKRNYPNSLVGVIVRQYTKDIFLNNPNVDKIICIDNPDGSEKTFWQLINEIKKLKFSHAFMLLPNEKLNYILFLAGIKHRVGVGHKLYQFLTFTKYVDRNKYNPLKHEADYCLDMLRMFGMNISKIHPEIFFNENELFEAQKFKERINPEKKILIGVNTTSGNSAPNLSTETYRKLIELLSANENYKVAVTDINPLSAIKNIQNVEYIMNNDTLRSAIIKFSSLDLLISSSTGPMHICSALQIPTFSFFCPLTACSPKLWGPLGNVSEIILPSDEYCSRHCPIDPKKCNYSKPGGLEAEYLYTLIDNFVTKILSK